MVTGPARHAAEAAQAGRGLRGDDVEPRSGLTRIPSLTTVRRRSGPATLEADCASLSPAGAVSRAQDHPRVGRRSGLARLGADCASLSREATLAGPLILILSGGGLGGGL